MGNKKAVFLTLLLATLPLAFGYYLTETAPHRPTIAYHAAYCTRHCTLHGCRHATPANSPAYFQLRPVYAGTIWALKLGGRYELANVGLYVMLVPALLLVLTYGALRDAGRIRQLRQRRV